jgi:hypothetical protein
LNSLFGAKNATVIYEQRKFAMPAIHLSSLENLMLENGSTIVRYTISMTTHTLAAVGIGGEQALLYQ